MGQRNSLARLSAFVLIALLALSLAGNLTLLLGVIAAAVVLLALNTIRQVRKLSRRTPTGIPVRRFRWGRWILRLLTLGLAAVVVLLVVTKPSVNHLTGQRTMTCPFTPWGYWRHGYPLTLGGNLRFAAYFYRCTAAVADRWHIAWVLGIGAVALLVGSILPSPYRES